MEKHVPTFEEFVSEAIANKREKRGDDKIYFIEMSDIDFTRLVKWMGRNLEASHKDYEFTKGGKLSMETHTLDTSKLSERDLTDLIHYLDSEKYKFSTLIWLPAYESITMDAVYIHSITGSGQDGAQNFIDDNELDGKKIADYLKANRNEKYNVRDLIAGTGIGAQKAYRQRMLKLFKK